MSAKATVLMVVAGLAATALLTVTSSATGASSADWKKVTFVFKGSGRSDYTYPPQRAGKSQTFTIDWEITWTLVPNQGYPKNVSEKIDGKSTYVGNTDPSCKGAVKKAPGVLAPMNPTGANLYGASVPMFNFLAHVPSCKNKPGEAAVANYCGPPAYVKHKLAVGEVKFDNVKPKKAKLRYTPSWKGKCQDGSSSAISWSGTLEVTVQK
jgi:hypothetical protein